MRVEIGQAAVQKRRIDFMLEHFEHAVDEADQIVQRDKRLVDVAIRNRVEEGDVAVN